MRKMSIALLSIFLLAGCTASSKTDKKPVELTTEEKADMSSYTLLQGDDHNFKKTTMEEAMGMLENGESFVLYVGYPGCKYCQQAVPVMGELAKETNTVIYYVNIETASQEAVDVFEEYALSFMQKDQSGVPTLYVPFVVAIKNKEVKAAHTGIAPSAKTVNMTAKEKEELKKIYKGIFDKAE